MMLKTDRARRRTGTHRSTTPLYRVILCATYITKMNDDYAYHRGARCAPLLFRRFPRRTAAFAHAHLQQQTPAADSTVAASPESLTLSFSEGIETAFSAVTLTGPQQKAVATGKLTRSDSNKAQLIVPLTQPLAAGEYTVDWHVVSVDGHKTKGQYHFTVK